MWPKVQRHSSCRYCDCFGTCEHDLLSLSPPQFEVEGLLTWVLVGSLGLSLVLSFVIIPLSRFHLGRAYGIFLLVFYATFLIIALLTEFGMIHNV